MVCAPLNQLNCPGDKKSPAVPHAHTIKVSVFSLDKKKKEKPGWSESSNSMPWDA